MNLYKVETEDTETYVVAKSYTHAIEKWREKLDEGDTQDHSTDEPDVVYHVAQSDDLIL